MASIKSLTWNDRIALINHFKPNDDEACSIFGVTKNELSVVRNLEGKMFHPTRNLDYSKYETIFGKKHKAAGSTIHTVGNTTLPPLSGSKPIRATRKRGGQGNKVAAALETVPYEPTPAIEFATARGVSMNTLHQHGRFDKSPHLGQVHVKKDKTTRTLMIWRDKP